MFGRCIMGCIINSRSIPVCFTLLQICASVMVFSDMELNEFDIPFLMYCGLSHHESVEFKPTYVRSWVLFVFCCLLDVAIYP